MPQEHDSDIVSRFYSTYSVVVTEPLDSNEIYAYVWDRFDGNQPGDGSGNPLGVFPGKKELFWHVYSDLPGAEILTAQGGAGEDHYLGARDVQIDGKDAGDDGYLWILDYEPGVDKLIFPFQSSIAISFDGEYLSFKTDAGKTDRVFRLGGGYSIEQISSSIAFLDTITNGIITVPYKSGASTPSVPSNNSDALYLRAPTSFGLDQADIITNYNPKTDQPILIDLDSFEGAAGRFKIAKKTKQVAKLAKSDIDFIYDQQAGYLYYNENGEQPGMGDGGIFAILEGKPKVGLGTFQFA